MVARDGYLNRDVMIDTIDKSGLSDSQIEELLHQIRTVAALGDHPHILTTYDVSEERDYLYFVSQYQFTGSLEALLGKSVGRRLPVADAVRIAIQVCEALASVHESEMVHGELNPAALWFAEHGDAVVGAFGFHIGEERWGNAVALPAKSVFYFTPEEAQGRAPESRSDLYGIGLLLHEMLTGRAPFVGDSTVAVLSQHVNARPAPPSLQNRDVPPALDALIARLLEKDPARRPESAAATRDALQSLGDVTARESGGPAAASPEEPERTIILKPRTFSLERLNEGTMVGRDTAAKDLQAALDGAFANSTRLVLVSGPAGIGKSRLVEEVSRCATLMQGDVLIGRCRRDGRLRAFDPWAQILDSCVERDEPDRFRAEAGDGIEGFSRITRAVASLADAIPPLPEEGRVARIDLVESLSGYLKKRSQNRPLLIVIEDLDQADEASLPLLRALIRDIDGLPMMILVTWRDLPPDSKDATTGALQELARSPLAQSIALRPLNRLDIARFVELLSGIKPHPTLITAIFKATDGLPLCVLELLRWLALDGRLFDLSWQAQQQGDFPIGLQAIVKARLEQLSGGCRNLVNTVSVLGCRFDLAILRRMLDEHPAASSLSAQLNEALREAVAVRLLHEDHQRPGSYRFGHPLVHEIVLAQQPARRTAELHDWAAAAIEKEWAEDIEPHLAELSEHLLGAIPASNDIGKAAAYLRHAGESALKRLGYEEAAAHFARSRKLLEPFGQAAATEQCSLLIAEAEAWDNAGDAKKAHEVRQLAVNSADELQKSWLPGASSLLAQSVLGLAGNWVESDTPNIALIELLKEALEAIGEAESDVRVHVQTRLAAENFFGGLTVESLQMSHDALETARGLNDPATLAVALDARRLTLDRPDDAQKRMQLSTELTRVAVQARHKPLQRRAAWWRALDCLECGDIAGTDRALQTFAKMADSSATPQDQYYSRLFTGMRALIDGEFKEAESQAQKAVLLGRSSGNSIAVQQFGIAMLLLRREQGRTGEIESTVKMFYQRLPLWRCAMAFVQAEVGRDAKARQEIEQLAGRDFRDLPRDSSWLLSLCLLGEACRLVSETRRAQQIYALLQPFSARFALAGRTLAAWGPVARALGLLAACAGSWKEAARHFEQALELARAVDAPPWVARIQLDYGTMLLEARDGLPAQRHAADEALVRLAEAVEIGQPLGMVDLCNRATNLLRDGQLAARRSCDEPEVAAEPEPEVEEDLTSWQIQGEFSSEASSIVRLDSSSVVERGGTRTTGSLPQTEPGQPMIILFTDMEGSTALIQRLGEERARSLMQTHNSVIRANVHAFRGTEVNFTGDGFMTAFVSASAALDCAIAIQRSFAKHNRENPMTPIRVRIGINAGETLSENGQLFGAAVNASARVCAKAEPGQILVSEVVRYLTLGKTITLIDRGKFSLKGFDERFRLFELPWQETR